MQASIFDPELIIEVTNLCNMKCKGCYAPNVFTTDASNEVKSTRNLTLEKLKENWPFNYTLQNISVRGGEPFLNPEIINIIKFLTTKAQKIFIETNGFWITDTYSTFESLKTENVVIKISNDKMHNSNYNVLEKKLNILSNNGIQFAIAITAKTEDIFSAEAIGLRNVIEKDFLLFWHPLATNEHSLLKPKLGIINSLGSHSNGLTTKFTLPTKSLLSLTLAFIFVFSTGIAFSKNKIYIGLASNFSEASSSNTNPYGNYFLDGISLALKKYEKDLQKKNIQIEFLKFDYGNSQSKVNDITSEALKSKAVAVLGYNYSSHALIAAPLHVLHQTPMISISGTASRLQSFPQYIHTTCFDNSIMGKSLANLAETKIRSRHVGIITASDCAYCVDLAQSFKKIFTLNKQNKISEFSILDSDEDYSELIRVIKNSSRIDAFLIPNHELTSAKIIHALLANKINAVFLGGDGWGDSGEEFFSVINNSSFHGYSLTHWNKDQKNSETIKFIQDYALSFKKQPTDTSALAYDAMSFILTIIIKENIKTRAALEKALAKEKIFEGITGRMELENGKVKSKTVYILESKNNKFISL